jgi:hypothetical protein
MEADRINEFGYLGWFPSAAFQCLAGLGYFALQALYREKQGYAFLFGKKKRRNTIKRRKKRNGEDVA